MFQLRACFAVGILALVACGDDNRNVADAAVDQQMIDAKVWMDAPPPTFDFACTSNTTPPATADAQITLSGVVQSVGGGVGGITVTPVEDAAVVACKSGGAVSCTVPTNQDGDDTTDAQGAWSIGPIDTGDAPLDDYLEMTATGQRTTYVYPASPFVADQSMIPMLTFDSAFEGTLSTFLSCDTSQAIVGLALVDCANMPITDSANVTITVKQGGAVVSGTNVIDLGSFQAEAAGTFLVCGVPANDATEVSATYMSTQLLPHNVKTVAGDTTATLLVPGYPAP